MGKDFDDEPDTDVETLGDDAVVEVSDAEIAAELRGEPVTKPHDGGEWLAGFNMGVPAGRNDYENGLKAVLGDGQLFNEIAQKVRLILSGS